jgi:hypothetical protein
MWVFPPQSREKAQVRQAVFNGISKALQRVILTAQETSWVDPADSDPDKATYGSDLLNLAGFDTLRIQRPNGITRGALDASIGTGGTKSYPAILARLMVEETHGVDETITPGVPLRELDTTIGLPTEAPGQDDLSEFIESEIDYFVIESVTTTGGSSVVVRFSKNFAVSSLPSVSSAWRLHGTSVALSGSSFASNPTLTLGLTGAIPAAELATAKLRLTIENGEPIEPQDGSGGTIHHELIPVTSA